VLKNNKNYIYVKSHKVSDVGFWQDIKLQNICGNIQCVDNTKIKLSSGIYLVLFGVQVVSIDIQDVSIGIFCRDKFIPEFVVMTSVLSGCVGNLAGNGILVLEQEKELCIKNMTNGKIDCYEMMLSICKLD